MGEIQPWGFRLLQVGVGWPHPLVRGPSWLPKRGLVAPGARTEVPECVHLGPAVNWVWRGRPSSGGGSPGAACGCGCGGGILFGSTRWPFLAGNHICLNSAMSSDPLHVGPGGSSPVGRHVAPGTVGLHPWRRCSHLFLILMAKSAESHVSTASLDSASPNT